MSRVMFDGPWRGRLGPADPGPHPGDEALETGDRFFDDARFLPLIRLGGQAVPVVVPGIERADHGVASGAGARFRIVDREGAAGRVKIDELFAREPGGIGNEDEVADGGDGFALADAEVDLARAGVDAHGQGLRHKLRREMLRAHQLENGALDVGIRKHGAAADGAAVGDDAGDPFATGRCFHEHLLDHDVFAELDAVALQLPGHLFDEQIGAAAKRVHALAHEVREHDAVGDGGVVEGGAVGIGDGLHEKALHVIPAREIALQHLARGLRIVVVKVHRPQVGEKPLHGIGRHLELLNEQPREIRAVEGGGEGELRIDEADAFELDDGVGDFLRPVFARRLDHADGEAVQRDVEDVSALAREPRGQAAQLVVMFEQQDLVAALGEAVGAGQAGEPAADHHDVIIVVDSFEPIVSHETFH